jgi:putative SOS response-associated peptidase YedK
MSASERFCNHNRQLPGERGLSCDWNARFRLWADEDAGRPPRQQAHSRTLAPVAIDVPEAHWDQVLKTFAAIRNTNSPHWRTWLKPENRCLIPANSFAEYAPNPNTKKKDVVWFAINEDRPLFAFAGIWTEFKGDRSTKSKPIHGPHLVYGFLTLHRMPSSNRSIPKPCR